MPEPAAATCAGCGCLCDDLVVRAAGDALELVSGACPRGRAWFGAHTGVRPPLARVDGVPTPLYEALAAGARILGAAQLPLVFGLGAVSCEAQREAVALADAIGAVVDPAGPLFDGAGAIAFATTGASTATLGEIRDRARVVVVWSADPLRTHPRLLERLRLDRASRAADRTLVLVGHPGGETAAEADVVLALAPDDHVPAIWALRALVRGLPVDAALAAGLPLDALAEVAALIAGVPNAAIVAGPAGAEEATALALLVRDLLARTHVVTLPLRQEGNAAGAQDVLAWQTGHPAAVSLAAGHPAALPGELRASVLLARGEVDAALVVGCDALTVLPANAVAGLRRIPMVCIDARATETADVAQVALAPDAAGVRRPGTAHRMDGVPVPLPAVLPPDRPGADDLLAGLLRLVRGSAAA